MNYLFELPCFGEVDGKIGTFEPVTIPGFQVNRIFYIFDVPKGEKRADHACMNSDIVFIAMSGSVTLSIETGGIKRDYYLSSRTQSVFAPAGSWIIAHDFSRDAVLMGLSDRRYQDCEYQNDYEKYKRKEN